MPSPGCRRCPLALTEPKSTSRPHSGRVGCIHCRIPIENLVAASRCSTGKGAGYIVEMRRWRLLIHLRSSLWFIPVICVVAGTGVAIGTIAVDRAFDYNALPTSVVGGPDAAESILS